MEQHVERRKHKRRTAPFLAWADPGGVLPVIDCTIINLSADGAQVAVPPGVEMPQVFQLQIDSSRILGAAEVVWRQDNRVGVRFLNRIDSQGSAP